MLKQRPAALRVIGARPLAIGEKNRRARVRHGGSAKRDQFGICTTLPAALKLIASPAAGFSTIGGRLAVVI